MRSWYYPKLVIFSFDNYSSYDFGYVHDITFHYMLLLLLQVHSTQSQNQLLILLLPLCSGKCGEVTSAIFCITESAKFKKLTLNDWLVNLVDSKHEKMHDFIIHVQHSL